MIATPIVAVDRDGGKPGVNLRKTHSRHAALPPVILSEAKNLRAAMPTTTVVPLHVDCHSERSEESTCSPTRDSSLRSE